MQFVLDKSPPHTRLPLFISIVNYLKKSPSNLKTPKAPTKNLLPQQADFQELNRYSSKSPKYTIFNS